MQQSGGFWLKVEVRLAVRGVCSKPRNAGSPVAERNTLRGRFLTFQAAGF